MLPVRPESQEAVSRAASVAGSKPDIAYQTFPATLRTGHLGGAGGSQGDLTELTGLAMGHGKAEIRQRFDLMTMKLRQEFLDSESPGL